MSRHSDIERAPGASCPECCVKHLLAARSLVLLGASTRKPQPSDLLWARVAILGHEVVLGYRRNIPLLWGDLAALEQLETMDRTRAVVRDIRKALTLSYAAASRVGPLAEGRYSLSALLWANKQEALREAPPDYRWSLAEWLESEDFDPVDALATAMDISDDYSLGLDKERTEMEGKENE